MTYHDENTQIVVIDQTMVCWLSLGLFLSVIALTPLPNIKAVLNSLLTS